MYPLRSSKMLLRLPKITEAQYSTEPLKLEKVLLLSKLSRLEVEKHICPDLNEKELEKFIKKKGLNYETLLQDHNINKNFRERVNSTFEKFGISVRLVNRFNCCSSDLDWCDAVFPIGGDGTFLHTARYIPNRQKPVIGFNSDPSRSEGYLCLPKKYTSEIDEAVNKLLQGKFKWMFRTRIRVNFSGEVCKQIPTELHDVKAHVQKLSNIVGKEKKSAKSIETKEIKQNLPILALNEVFMSEIFAAKVSYFEMRLNNSQQSVKVKSSGLCVCTGTGSTSWNLSINRLSRQDIHNILKIYIDQTKEPVKQDFETLVNNVSSSFNKKLKFDPESPMLGYTIRDLISLRVWPSPKGVLEPRGFAEKIQVKSNCLDAGMIVDGGVSFPFNEGDIAFLETRPEDALRTVVLME